MEEPFDNRPISHDNSNQRIRSGMKNARLRNQSRKLVEIKSVRRIGNRGVVARDESERLANTIDRRRQPLDTDRV